MSEYLHFEPSPSTIIAYHEEIVDFTCAKGSEQSGAADQFTKDAPAAAMAVGIFQRCHK